jgi:hypothetical protein
LTRERERESRIRGNVRDLGEEGTTMETRTNTTAGGARRR